MHSILLALLLFSMATFGQSVNTRLGARAAALGYASFALTDEATFFNNPGASAWNSVANGFFSYEVAASLPGANRTAAGILIPVGSGCLGAGLFRFGDDLYSEQFLGAGFSHRLGNTSLGAKVQYVQYNAHGYETRTAVTLDVGGLIKITPEWSIGAGISNVTQTFIASEEPLPMIFSAALAWQAPRGPLITSEVEKQLGNPLRIKGGIEVPLYQKLFMRTGFGLNPVTLSLGLGAKTRRSSFDFSTTYHPSIGFFNQASAAYRFGKTPSS